MIIYEDSKTKLLINKEGNFKRIFGIDLLKILAMINIINLHINRYSLNLRININDPKYKEVYRLQIFSFWPVDAFGIISGLVNFKKFKFSNLLYIWFEYFYYSIFFSIYLYKKSLLNKRNLILSFFPVAIKRYWYANAYIFLYLLLPFLTNFISSIDKNLFTKLIISYFFLYSFYHKLVQFNIGGTNFDFINEGYSSIWLIILYISGGYIGRFHLHNPKFSKLIYILLYLISSFLTCEYTFYSSKKYKAADRILISYNSPTIIIQALSLIFFFYHLQITNKYIQKIILFFNPLNFNVALIHLRIFEFKTNKVLHFFNLINKLDKRFLFFKIYAISLLIYFICAFFDYFRFILFKLLKIKSLCIYIGKKFK